MSSISASSLSSASVAGSGQGRVWRPFNKRQQGEADSWMVYEFFRSSDIQRPLQIFVDSWEDGRQQQQQHHHHHHHHVSGLSPALLSSGTYTDSSLTSPLLSLALAGSSGTEGPGDEEESHLFCRASIFCDGEEIGLSARTSAAILQPGGRCVWSEWLDFPVTLRELSLDAEVILTILTLDEHGREVPVGGSSLPLFTASRTLRKGRQKLIVCRGAEGSLSLGPKMKGLSQDQEPLFIIERLLKRYDLGQLDRVQWLDLFSLAKLADLKKKFLVGCYLDLQLPIFDCPVLWCDPLLEDPTIINSAAATAPEPSAAAPLRSRNSDREAGRPSSGPLLAAKNEIVVVCDPEVSMENPVDEKRLKLSRSRRRGLFDRDLKATAQEKRLIQQILAYPPNKPLSVVEKDFLWRFRYYLGKEKKALTKFLQCVDWNDKHQSARASVHLERWEKIDLADALELFSRRFRHAKPVRCYAVQIAHSASDQELQGCLLPLVQSLRYEEFDRLHSLGGEMTLLAFLIARSAQNFALANFFFWYLSVETDPHYKAALDFLTKNLPLPWLQIFGRQKQLVHTLEKIAIAVKSSRQRTSRLRELISPGGELDLNPLLAVDAPHGGLPLPMDPSVRILTVLSNKGSVFSSKMAPVKLTFTTYGGEPYSIIFKVGDDLRQDQLIQQLVALMDSLLKREYIDMKLHPYPVLATGNLMGMLQCVPECRPIAAVLKEDGRLRILPEQMEDFVRSCAGYCVITYLLGVGDRHLDNLMLTNNGQLFHIDFGFILGHDPKPFPPPMKLCKEMVEGMGGYHSVPYTRFKEHCVEAFNLLRKSSNLILNLFSLMIDADIADIRSLGPEKSLLKLAEKFSLNLTDEQAVHAFQQLINESVSALFPQLSEIVHKWAKYWRMDDG